MKIEHRREATEAGRQHLAQALQSLQIITPLLEEAAREGDKSAYLRVGVMWDKALTRAQEAKKLSDELLGEEVQTWIEKS